LDDNTVKVIFEGDLYRLQNSSEDAQKEVENFKDVVSENLEETGNKFEELGERANEASEHVGGGLSRAATEGGHGVHLLSRGVMLSARAFDEHARRNMMAVVELGHLAHAIPMASRGVQALSESVAAFSKTQAAAFVMNPMALAAMAATGVYFLTTHFLKSGDAAEEAGKKFEKYWEKAKSPNRGYVQSNMEEEATEELKKAQKKMSEAVEARKKAEEARDNYKPWGGSLGSDPRASSVIQAQHEANERAVEEARKKEKEAGVEQEAARVVEREAKIAAAHKKSGEEAAAAVEKHVMALEDEMEAQGKSAGAAAALASAKGKIVDIDNEVFRVQGAKKEDAEKEGRLMDELADDKLLRKREEAAKNAARLAGREGSGLKSGELWNSLESAKGSSLAKPELERINKIIGAEGANAARSAIEKLNRETQEHNRELGMTSVEAKKAWKEYEAFKAVGYNLPVKEAQEYRKALQGAADVQITDYIRDTNEALEIQRKAFGMDEESAKKYREEEAELKKLGIDRNSAQGKQVLAKLAEKQEADQNDALKKVIESLEDERKQLTMSADAYAKYQEAKKAGLLNAPGAQGVINAEMDRNAVLKMHQDVGTLPGQKAFEDRLEQIKDLMGKGLSTDDAALAMQKAQNEFVPHEAGGMADVKGAWAAANSAAGSGDNPQVKATDKVAKAIEDRVLGKDVHATLLKDIAGAVKRINNPQRP